MKSAEEIRAILCYQADDRILSWLDELEAASGKAVADKLLLELYQLEATLWDFWLIFIFSYTDNIQDNLDLLTRLKTSIGKKRPLCYADVADEEGKSKLLS